MAMIHTPPFNWKWLASCWCLLWSLSWAQDVGPEYAGIEIGSEGIKGIVGTMVNDVFVSVPTQEETRNLGMVGALVTAPSGVAQFSEEALKSLGETLDEFLKGFQARSIPASRVHVAVSSGLAERAGTHTGELNATLRPLNALVRERIGRDVTIVTPAEEAKWTFNGTVQQADRRSSTLVIDVGGGNSKFATETQQADFPLGARTFAAQITTQDIDQQRQAANQQLRKAFDQLELGKIRRIYLTGGSAYIASVLSAPNTIAESPRALHSLGTGQSNTLTTLLRTFQGKRLISDVFDPLIAAQADAETKTLLTKAKGIYDLGRLTCGMVLLEQSVAIVQAQHPHDAISVEFYGDGQVAWMKGFMQEQLKRSGSEPDPGLHSSLEQISVEVRLLREHLERSRPLHTAMSDAIANLPTAHEVALLRRDIHGLQTSLEAGFLAVAESIRDARKPRGQVPTPSRTSLNEIKQSERQHWEAMREYRRGKYFEARGHCNQSIATWPQNKHAWYLLVVIDTALGDELSAEFASRQVVNLIGDDASQHHEIARAFERIQGPVRAHAERLLHIAKQDSIQPRQAMETE